MAFSHAKTPSPQREDELETVSDRINNVIADMSQTAVEAEGTFGNLSIGQLNWKPAEKSWSIAQCFDHFITSHSLYFTVFERLAAGNVMPTFWERYSPLSGFFGRFLIKSLRPENLKKMKTTAKAFASASEIDASIIERYCAHQYGMIKHLRRLPIDIDPVKTIITSPLASVVTYSLDDCFTILTVHGPRHFGQAKRVMEAEGFPK